MITEINIITMMRITTKIVTMEINLKIITVMIIT